MIQRKIVYPVLGAIAVILVVGTALDTQSQQLPLYKVAPSEQRVLQTPPPAPTALSPMQRIERYQEVLKEANLQITYVPPISHMKVTPMAPRDSSGAEITYAGVMSFQGAKSGTPDGSYGFLRGLGTGVTVRIPTEVNKLYILDCQLHPYNSKVMVVGAGGGPVSTLAVENDHALYAFQASAESTELLVTLPGNPESSWDFVGYFYGCEITKAN